MPADPREDLAPPARAPRIDAREFEALIADNVDTGGRFDFHVLELAFGRALLRLRIGEFHLRPGASVSGPVMFTLADTALYAAVLSVVGMQPLAVTTDMTMHFLRRPPLADLIADARIHRQGTKLMYGDVFLRSEGVDEPVCHATGTYAVPPGGRR